MFIFVIGCRRGVPAYVDYGTASGYDFYLLLDIIIKLGGNSRVNCIFHTMNMFKHHKGKTLIRLVFSNFVYLSDSSKRFESKLHSFFKTTNAKVFLYSDLQHWLIY